MAIYEEIDFREHRATWGLDKFLQLTKNGHRPLVVRNAFNTATTPDAVIAPKDCTIRYTTQQIDFKTGHSYQPSTVRKYLTAIETAGEYYCSWGHSSMNDQPDAVQAYREGAQSFLDRCGGGWDELIATFNTAAEPDFEGHFIAGNTTTPGVKTNNHFAFSVNHVFALFGEKTWYLCDPVKAMKSPLFTQFNPMEFAMAGTTEDYINLPYVETMVLRAGDYFYNPPMIGHAVAMGEGKNAMLSIRSPTREFHLSPPLQPLLYRCVNVVRNIIHADTVRFRRWHELTPLFDNELYGDGTPAVDRIK